MLLCSEIHQEGTTLDQSVFDLRLTSLKVNYEPYLPSDCCQLSSSKPEWFFFLRANLQSLLQTAQQISPINHIDTFTSSILNDSKIIHSPETLSMLSKSLAVVLSHLTFTQMDSDLLRTCDMPFKQLPSSPVASSHLLSYDRNIRRHT